MNSNQQSSLIAASDQALALWVFAFAISHIGLSAVRTSIISSFATAADTLNLVNNENWRLPDWWPGDGANGNRIFPDVTTTGRQLYRAMYTAVSFVTLGSAFTAYLHASYAAESIAPEDRFSSTYNACLLISALSLGTSTASLFNASPLGLMPGFERDTKDIDGEKVLLGSIKRNDALKFTSRGLTRITRHPLILPVVPWGMTTAYLTGGRTCDYVLFGGLSIYAIAGCFAQDLRVIKEEGSVGTVFQTEIHKQKDDEVGERTQLRKFFDETSFIPFEAVFDGRQSLNDICTETPWLQLCVGTLAGIVIEKYVIQLLHDWSFIF